MVSIVERESGLIRGLGGVSNEAASRVGVDANHKEEGQVVGVPEYLKGLFADVGMSGGIHENHDEEHEVASDPSGLFVVNVLSRFLADF